MSKANHYFDERRREQAKYWMYETIHETLRQHFYHHSHVKTHLPEYEQKVLNDQISSFIAARQLLDKYFGTLS